MPSIPRFSTPLTPNQPSPTSESSRPTANAADLSAGCILWLRCGSASHSIRCVSCAQVHKLGKGGSHHPCVVLRLFQRGNLILDDEIVVQIAMITSFGDTSLSEYLQQRPSDSKFTTTIPIVSRSQEKKYLFRTGIPSLKLANKKLLIKTSYVCLDHIYEAPVRVLGTYESVPNARAYHRRLDDSSYETLMRELRIQQRQIHQASSLEKIHSVKPENHMYSGTEISPVEARVGVPVFNTTTQDLQDDHESVTVYCRGYSKLCSKVGNQVVDSNTERVNHPADKSRYDVITGPSVADHISQQQQQQQAAYVPRIYREDPSPIPHLHGIGIQYSHKTPRASQTKASLSVESVPDHALFGRLYTPPYELCASSTQQPQPPSLAGITQDAERQALLLRGLPLPVTCSSSGRRQRRGLTNQRIESQSNLDVQLLAIFKFTLVLLVISIMLYTLWALIRTVPEQEM